MPPFGTLSPSEIIYVSSNSRHTQVTQHSVCLEDGVSLPGFSGSEELRLKIILDVVDQVARYLFLLEEPMHGHLQWIDEPEASRLVNDVSLPTDISMNKILTSLPQRMALAQLMRAPGLYDGCVDYVFERLIKVAVSLLFSDTDRFFLLKRYELGSIQCYLINWRSHSTSHYPPFGNSPLPLIVACESSFGNACLIIPFH